MKPYAGIDVSLEYSSVCVVDADGRIVREAKILSEPDALIAWFGEHDVAMERIGLEAGPLSQWLHAGMVKAGLCVELIETLAAKISKSCCRPPQSEEASIFCAWAIIQAAVAMILRHAAFVYARRARCATTFSIIRMPASPPSVMIDSG